MRQRAIHTRLGSAGLASTSPEKATPPFLGAWYLAGVTTGYDGRAGQPVGRPRGTDSDNPADGGPVIHMPALSAQKCRRHHRLT